MFIIVTFLFHKRLDHHLISVSTKKSFVYPKSLLSGRSSCYLKLVILETLIKDRYLEHFLRMCPRWMLKDFNNDQSTLVHGLLPSMWTQFYVAIWRQWVTEICCPVMNNLFIKLSLNDAYGLYVIEHRSMTQKSVTPTLPSCINISWRGTTLSLPKKLTSSTACLEWFHVHFTRDLYITFIRRVVEPSKKTPWNYLSTLDSTINGD